jgi:hypothetical protein
VKPKIDEPRADPILREIVQRLVRGMRPTRIYLFGSRGRGNGVSESDYDILVVVPDSDEPRYRRDQRAFRMLCGVGASKNVIVLTQAEFERQAAVLTSLAATVLREGRLLHAG